MEQEVKKMNEDKINTIAMNLLSEIAGTVYDCMDDNADMENIRILTLGNIWGVIEMANALRGTAEYV